jgi:glycine/D-amino acid oxidase-like deaminating enzyme
MIDYIIVGQGLAGTVLAHVFKKEGREVIIAEEESRDAASSVAAGIYNPVTGKRMVKTWKANILFPFLEKFYKDMELLLNEQFLYDLPIYKPFGSIEEQNHWISQSAFADVEDLVNTSISASKYDQFIHNKYGGFETLRSGFLDVAKLISLYRSYAIKNGFYVKKKFQFTDMTFKDGYVEWNGIKSKRLIFCEGYKATFNPYFKWLPFVLAKGELLTVKTRDEGPDAIINKGVFMLPQGKNVYKVGATYQWDYKDNAISEAAKQELTQKLDLLIKVPYEVTRQESGIRPTVKDRRPILGLHPQFKTLGIFNGLGTKGVSLAPYFAKMLCDFLEKGEDLEPEVNIERFIPLYYSLKE